MEFKPPRYVSPSSFGTTLRKNPTKSNVDYLLDLLWFFKGVQGPTPTLPPTQRLLTWTVTWTESISTPLRCLPQSSLCGSSLDLPLTPYLLRKNTRRDLKEPERVEERENEERVFSLIDDTEYRVIFPLT